MFILLYFTKRDFSEEFIQMKENVMNLDSFT